MLETVNSRIEKSFKYIGAALIAIPLAVLAVLIFDIVSDGAGRFTWQFLSSYPSRFASKAGILPALAGSLFVISLTAFISVVLGVGAAIYLEEYAKDNWFTRIVEINISNLAGVPSVIYGILGLALFVRTLGLGRSVLAGALTLSLMSLPVVIVSTRESLRLVPRSLREATWALGVDKWETIRRVVLPMSLPGILTGLILAVSRAIGETAPLVTIGALAYVAFLPSSVMSPFTALPIQIFNWISRPQQDFHANAAAGIIVLLILLVVANGGAILLRNRMQRRMH